MLATWHTLQTLRLQQEQIFHLKGRSGLAVSLNPNELPHEQRHALKEALEAIAVIQRHVEIIYSGMGE